MFRFLVVDDSPADVQLLRLLLAKLGRPHEIYYAKNGIEAMDFLHRRGRYSDAPRPNLILLDINVPKMNGFDVLGAIKNDPDLSVIPVIMLSGSRLASDIRRAYQHHANCYVQKPSDLESAKKMIQAIDAFWVDLAVLPPSEDCGGLAMIARPFDGQAKACPHKHQ